MVGLDNYLKDPTFNMNNNVLPAKKYNDNSGGYNSFTTVSSIVSLAVVFEEKS